MNVIVAVDKNWAIGKDNKLLANIPEDMKFFRETTTGGVVVMGRKTLESFPNGKPLPKRTNIVLTNNQDYKVEGAIIVHSVDEALEKAKAAGGEIYVIGGENVYRQFLPLCDEALITRIDHSYEADAFFPNLDEDPEWELVDESDEETCFDITFTYCTYKRK